MTSTFALTITNGTKNELTVLNKEIQHGHWNVGPNPIKPGETVTAVATESASGAWTGDEFSCSWGSKDGGIALMVDIPFSGSNSSSLSTSGALVVEGWDGKLPSSGHTFAQTISVTAG